MANSAALDAMKSIKDITSVTVSGFKYMGKVDKLPEKSNIGDVYICNGEGYVYNNGWTEMGFTATQPDYPTTVTVEKMKPRLCTQCGAPLHSNKCTFCDTEYYYNDDVDYKKKEQEKIPGLTFYGTRIQWDNLSAEEKKNYYIVNLSC